MTPFDTTPTVDRLLARLGQDHADRIRLGVQQAAQRWRPEDGDAEAFSSFCEANFIADPEPLAATFQRLERTLEQVDGHLHEVRRTLTWPIDVETGPLTAADRLFAELDLAAHVEEDLFRTKVAFLALLNFPVHTLAERLEQGPAWDRQTWARSRFMDRFALRVPATVHQEITRVSTAAEQYVASYNVRLDRLVSNSFSENGADERPFPEGLRLISHWGLRDELASYYADPAPAGLARQRLILRVMERIVRQEIPAAVVDNPDLLWDPETNTVRTLEGNVAGDLGMPSPRSW
jgi:hypothetical protein